VFAIDFPGNSYIFSSEVIRMKEYKYKGFIITHEYGSEWYKVNDASYRTLKSAKNDINQYHANKASK